jgi:hypothetical protein
MLSLVLHASKGETIGPSAPKTSSPQRVAPPSPPLRRKTKRVHTEGPKTVQATTERYRATDCTPNGVHGRGGTTYKCCTSIDGRRSPLADADGFAIHSDA